MKIIFGLGNPGNEYAGTYHNIGFMFLDKLAKAFSIEFVKKKSINGEVCELFEEKNKILNIFGKNSDKNEKEKIILVKPLTYMNLSGECVLKTIKKYGAQLSDIIVVLDDVDLPCGKYRIREHGSSGTHNGLRNITQMLNSQDFKRVRIGIDSEKKENLADYVLSKISKENLVKIDKAIDEAMVELIERV